MHVQVPRGMADSLDAIMHLQVYLQLVDAMFVPAGVPGCDRLCV